MTMQSNAQNISEKFSGQVYIVLPAFNEGRSLSKLFRCIDDNMKSVALDYRVVIVDDGSTDDTFDVIEEFSKTMPVAAIRHNVNLGLGAAIRDGLAFAAGAAKDGDIIITMDADDTHSPDLILRMTEMIRKDFDVVIASRFRKGSRVVGVPFYRRVLSRMASVLFRLVLPIKGVKDFTCGYRAYRAEAIKKALSRYGENFFTRSGFECMVDILLRLRKMNLVFGELPIVLRYDYKEGQTKMKITRTVANTLLLLLKRKFHP
jgi:dolichol-phosphate mannosyltransferase